MVDAQHLQEVSGGPTTLEQVKGYLSKLGLAFSEETVDTGKLLRFPVCPIKGRDCGDQSYVIVQEDGDILGGCHGGKCDGTASWPAFQEVWGLTFADHLKGIGQKEKKPKSDPPARMVKLAQKHDKLFHTPDGRGFVFTLQRGYEEVLPIKGGDYKDITRLRFDDATGNIPKKSTSPTRSSTSMLSQFSVDRNIRSVYELPNMEMQSMSRLVTRNGELSW